MGEYQSVVVLRETHNLGIRMQGAGNTVIPRLSEHLWSGRELRELLFSRMFNPIKSIISYHTHSKKKKKKDIEKNKIK